MPRKPKAEPTVEEILAMAREAGVPIKETVEGAVAEVTEEHPPPAGETVEPSPFVLAKPVADWITMVAAHAMEVEPLPATVVAASLAQLQRELRGATQRKDARAVIGLSVEVGSAALRLFLVATPHYVQDEEKDPPPGTGSIIVP